MKNRNYLIKFKKIFNSQNDIKNLRKIIIINFFFKINKFRESIHYFNKITKKKFKKNN